MEVNIKNMSECSSHGIDVTVRCAVFLFFIVRSFEPKHANVCQLQLWFISLCFSQITKESILCEAATAHPKREKEHSHGIETEKQQLQQKQNASPHNDKLK